MMKKQTLNTIAKRFFLGNILAAMFFLSAGANTVDTKASAKDPGSKNVEVTYVGTSADNLFFNVKYNNETGKFFKVLVFNEANEIIFVEKYADKQFDKKFMFPGTQDISKLTFQILSEAGSYKEMFDVSVSTREVAEVSVKKN